MSFKQPHPSWPEERCPLQDSCLSLSFTLDTSVSHKTTLVGGSVLFCAFSSVGWRLSLSYHAISVLQRQVGVREHSRGFSSLCQEDECGWSPIILFLVGRLKFPLASESEVKWVCVTMRFPQSPLP